MTGYLFDQQMILDEMNRSLEQYSQLSPEAELFPQRSVEVMRMTQEQFEKMAALTPPEGYEEIVPLAEGAASTMEEVASLVEQAFAAGLDTQEGAGLLTQAQGEFSGGWTPWRRSRLCSAGTLMSSSPAIQLNNAKNRDCPHGDSPCSVSGHLVRDTQSLTAAVTDISTLMLGAARAAASTQARAS
ncbi:MAG: hypothetical protein V8Q30_13125 [Acutalibacteraceae bacterium]